MRNLTWQAALAATLLAAGCESLTPKWMTVGPDYERKDVDVLQSPLADPGFASGKREEGGRLEVLRGDKDPRVEVTPEMIDAWWTSFNDPLLTELIERAVTNSISYAIAQERLVQARWAYAASFGGLLPSFDMSGRAMRSGYHKETTTGASAGGRDLHSNTYHAGFDATWEIDIFGGTRRANESASAALDAAYCDVDAALVSLTAEIGSAYISLRTTQARVKTAIANLKLQSETYEILRSRLESGIGDELAVNQAKYNVDQTRATIPPLKAQEEAFMNAIAILVGDMPGTWHARLESLPARDWLVVPQKLSSIPVNALRARPDICAAERRLAAQVAQVGVKKAQLFPKFFINGSVGFDSPKSGDFFHRDAVYGTIGPSFSWPIFRGGAIYSEMKAAESRVEEATLNYELSVQKALGELRDAYSAYTAAYHRFESLKGAVDAAGAAVDISNDLYKNGLADFNNVLDAQRSKLSLEDSLTAARGDITLQLIKLYKAMGGGLAATDTVKAEVQEVQEL